MRHRRKLETEWAQLYAESTPDERAALRPFAISLRYPPPAHRARRFFHLVFPRKYPLPVIIGQETIIIDAEPPPARRAPRSAWLRQFAGLAAFCALSLIGISSIYWGPALAQAWLAAALPHVSTAPAAAGVLAVWAAVVSFPLGLSVMGTHAALRQAAVTLGG